MLHICFMAKNQKLSVSEVVGGNIRRLRMEKGFTQFDLAEKCGLERTQVGRIERGEISTSLKMLEIVAKALGIKIRDLIGDI